jgi:methylated-DNA-[protein]-cysteine S-methyltransferase
MDLKCRFGGGKLSKLELAVPIGILAISGCSKGIHEIDFKQVNQEEDSLRVLATNFQQKVRILVEEGVEDYSMKQECLSYFEDYFNHSFDCQLLSICWDHVSKPDTFGRRVLQSLYEKVGVGQTVSYKELANLAGNHNAQRAVGSTMRKNPVPIIIPCHRVIKRSKEIGNYNCGVAVKKWLLDFESE